MSHAQSHAASAKVSETQRFRIGTLLYFRDRDGRVLLMQRRRQPNAGMWCAVGGKLEMATGESPYECARREALEEVGMELAASDLALRCMLSERDYKGTGHWLMFVFEVTKPIEAAPDCIDEGCFQLFAVSELPALAIPELDRTLLLERLLGEGSRGFHILRAGPGADEDPSLIVEEERIGG